MKVRAQIREYLKTHPGAEASEVGKVLGLPGTNASTQLANMAARGLGVRREVVRRSPTNLPIYGYFIDPEWVPWARSRKAKATPQKKAKSVTHLVKSAVLPVTSGLDDALRSISSSIADALFNNIKADLMARLAHLPDALPAPKEDSPMRNVTVPVPVPASAALPPLANIFPAKEAPAKRPKILITGLLPQQAGTLAQAFGERLDLTFWKDGNYKQLRQLAVSNELVLIHTGHDSHSTQETVKSAGGNYRLVSGGVTALAKELHWYAAQKGAAQ